MGGDKFQYRSFLKRMCPIFQITPNKLHYKLQMRVLLFNIRTSISILNPWKGNFALVRSGAKFYFIGCVIGTKFRSKLILVKASFELVQSAT